MSPRIASATPLSLALAALLGCALGEQYDSDTKGPAKPTISSGASNASDADTDTDTDSGGTTSEESGEATWVTSESHSGGEATSDSGDVTTSPATGNNTWTTSGDGSGPTTDDCGGPCDSPPSDCYDAIGECSGSECLYYPLDSDASCDDGDPCTDNDLCDGAGSCAGAPIECATPPHATGGSCVEGVCAGFACEDPWENCDGDWDNGCEVPTGIAKQCDIDGLNPGGCWTAYCGSSDAENATNFGDFFCVSCSTCQQAGENAIQWCEHATGSWYPPESDKSCGMWLDLACDAP